MTFSFFDIPGIYRLGDTTISVIVGRGDVPSDVFWLAHCLLAVYNDFLNSGLVLIETPMASIAIQTTAAQLLAIPDDGQCYELIEGELRTMSPAGFEHGRIAAELCALVSSFVREHQLGAYFAAETGFLIQQNPDTVRTPDFAFVTQARMDEAGDVSGYWPGAPDLAAEVVSPSDTFSAVEKKALSWLNAGTKVVWIVDPSQQHVTAYRSSSDITVIAADEILEASDLLPVWSVPVSDLFPK